ncbi:MAG: acyl-CoA reductase [Bacteroidetes bacterium]|jgi:hypothetical protein|nr:acyl-CoA reductase [Bacteroidota bacterium]MBT5530528.1 acyl-CoA reductase [Cytophagia bacterium]MBT4968403.1 acyl-CoA reductase [Bacteroidota bacterium]MBT5991406.1 acyl-CoA reductase [Bacteroidota bacterium]MBT6836926.1 acyl-CoA reductase [Bacteroidota bacterium]
MEFEKRLKALIELGDFVKSGLAKNEFSELFHQAYIHNNWFTEEFCQLSFSSLVSHYLNEDKLNEWLGKYTFSNQANKKRIGLILAGNIPLVGIHDIISVFISGHISLLKLSAKDSILTKFFIGKLNEIDSESTSYFQIDDKLTGLDALIATGSDNSARYFEYYFRNCPKIIRKNRTSIAVLSGHETNEDLKLLEKDIFQYFGLGCRSVSKVFIPVDYDLNTLIEVFEKYRYFIDHNKYYNNYIYHKSIFLLNLDDHLDNGFLMLKENQSNHSPLAVLFYERYQNTTELENRIILSKDHLQVVVSKEQLSFPTHTFGSSQTPELWDYADEVDTLNFIHKL